MAVSVGATRSVGSASVASQAYSVSNQSQVSSSFVESMNSTSPAAIGAANPVQYPNAQVLAAKGVEKLEQAQQLEGAFNKVASNFEGASTGYDRMMDSTSYGIVGQNIDAYA